MDRYQLAKLVQWAEECPADGLKSRKRMQKIVFLLKWVGCPVDAEYLLHFYGPYSAEVAQTTDELVQAGLLVEESTLHQVGKQFNYKLSAGAADVIASFEATPIGVEARRAYSPFETVAKFLAVRDLNELEYASTVAYFQQRKPDWESAFEEMCKFKRLAPDSAIAKSSLELARQMAVK